MIGLTGKVEYMQWVVFGGVDVVGMRAARTSRHRRGWEMGRNDVFFFFLNFFLNGRSRWNLCLSLRSGGKGLSDDLVVRSASSDEKRAELNPISVWDCCFVRWLKLKTPSV